MGKFLFAREVTGDQNLKKGTVLRNYFKSETIHQEVKRGQEINEECKNKGLFMVFQVNKLAS